MSRLSCLSATKREPNSISSLDLYSSLKNNKAARIFFSLLFSKTFLPKETNANLGAGRVENDEVLIMKM